MTAPYWETALVPAGALPPRSWIAPEDTDAGSLCLDGRWDFRFGSRADGSDLPEFAAEAITVPGHWQLQGYGRPQYTNVRYPFPLDSPHVPENNPTGEYRRAFRVPAAWGGGRILLRFDGVDSCARVSLDGHQLGVTTGSRLPVEFDITALVTAGESSELIVRVHQWSAGSYVEDQDMWWLSGIFRSVTLLHRPDDGINDFWLDADYDPGTGTGTITAELDAAGASLSVPDLGITAVLKPGTPAILACGPVQPWSAEQPVLYAGSLSSGGERISIRLGFRRVRVQDGSIQVNGRPVLFRGVNRHEWDARTGRAVSAGVMAADVALLKENNFNAVRTAHYPPHPQFLALCDAAGLYVVDECDLETHGFLVDEFTSTPENPVLQPMWVKPLLDRMQRMVERDKNHPSVIMWSPGNESGAGAATDAMLQWAGKRDGSRLRIYEGDKSSRHADVYSLMYTPHDAVRAIGERREEPHADATADARRRTLPFLMVEYAHAMGLGPGGLSEYSDLFERYPRCQGGFIWEWIDMCIDTGDGRWLYGGDFGEEQHDGNFVADGLLFPDRTPSPALADVKAVFSPVVLDLGAAHNGQVRINNRHEVLNLSGFSLHWRAEIDGECMLRLDTPLPPLPPGGAADLPIPPEITAALRGGDGVRSLVVRVMADSGAELSKAAAVLFRPARSEPAVNGGAAPAALHGTGLARELRALFGAHTLVPRLWRAPIDNDRPLSWHPRDSGWRAAGLDKLRHFVEHHCGGITIRSDPPGGEWAMLTHLTGTSDGSRPDGADALDLSVTQVFTGAPPRQLPQMGLDLVLSEDYRELEWLGLGPAESYPDTGQGNTFGRYRAGLEGLATPYVYPQENGARAGIEWARLATGGGRRLELRSSRPVALALRAWSTEDLALARHGFELQPGTFKYLSLILGSSGVGTGSCGPGVLDSYLLPAAEQSVRLQLSASACPAPVRPTADEPAAAASTSGKAAAAAGG